jgi:hypothetical protein
MILPRRNGIGASAMNPKVWTSPVTHLENGVVAEFRADVTGVTLALSDGDTLAIDVLMQPEACRSAFSHAIQAAAECRALRSQP